MVWFRKLPKNRYKTAILGNGQSDSQILKWPFYSRKLTIKCSGLTFTKEELKETWWWWLNKIPLSLSQVSDKNIVTRRELLCLLSAVVRGGLPSMTQGNHLFCYRLKKMLFRPGRFCGACIIWRIIKTYVVMPIL